MRKGTVAMYRAVLNPQGVISSCSKRYQTALYRTLFKREEVRQGKTGSEARPASKRSTSTAVL